MRNDIDNNLATPSDRLLFQSPQRYNKQKNTISPQDGLISTNKIVPYVETAVQDLENLPLVEHKRESNHKAITLTFKDLHYSVQEKNPNKSFGAKATYHKREILRGMTGVCRPRELTAIMGASGAGKTTLLNILSVRTTSNRNNKLEGEFLANGQAYDVRKFSKFAGYVMQNDILLESMTPREIFQFTADLRLEGPYEQRKKKVDQLLGDLKLERAADTLVGGNFHKGISGGERKRTSIGVELMTDPNLLFLDEPTSGLDSFTAFVLISLLKNLALKEGKTIIFTIHQPSSDIFFLFDNLMILAKGKFIYQGSALNAVDYFGVIGFQCPEFTNPADYFIDLAHTENNSDQKFLGMYKIYDETIAPKIKQEVENVQKTEISLNQIKKNFTTCLRIIARRSTLDFFRNPIHLRGKIVQTSKSNLSFIFQMCIVFVTFLICSIYFQLSKNPNNPRAAYDINGALFFISVTLFMMAATAVALTFPSERAVFLREYSSNMYSVPAYYFGRSSVEIPFLILFPMIMTAVSYYIIGFNDSSPTRFFIFELVVVLMSLAGDATGLLIGSSFGDPKVASNLLPAIILPWMLFSGFFINSGSMPVWLGWIRHISPFHYALEAFMWNEYEDSAFGTSQLDNFDFTFGLWASLGLLAIIGLIFRIASLFLLKSLVKRLE